MLKDKKGINLMTWGKILRAEFTSGHTSLLDLITGQVVMALNLKRAVLCQSITEIITE